MNNGTQMNWSKNDPSSPFNKKRGRDDSSDFTGRQYHHSGRRFKHDFDRSPRGARRRGGGGPNHFTRSINHISENFLQSFWSLGDSERFDFRQEIPELVHRIENHFSQFPDDVLKAFRIAAAELPHKLPHLALLISLLSVAPLHIPNAPPADPPPSSIGVQIIRDLARSFQLHIDNRRWRSTRLFLHLFGHLHALSQPLVSSQSLLALLRAIFSATTDELTCTGARADECLRIVCEGLLKSGLLKVDEVEIKREVSELIDSIRVHMVVNRRVDRSLFNEPHSLSQYVDPIEELVASLEGRPSVDILPVLDEPFRPLLELRMKASGADSPYPKPFDLPIVLLPPDTEEPGLDAHPAPKPQTSVEGPGPIPLDSKDRKNYFGVKLLLPLFSDDTVPSRATPNGVVLRTLVNDVIDIFEVNRKECAKILLELPRWVGRGTFKTKLVPAAAKPPENQLDKTAEEPLEKGSDWVLEHLVLESILCSAFAMPSPPIRPLVYYYSLIAELCRLSPSTVAPGLGKCVRRLYTGLGETGTDVEAVRLEPEGIRRFSDWFAIHLSNFGFLWAWKDWSDAIDLPLPHPKRVFVSRVIELEIRLSYFDRIKGTVPDIFIESELIPSEAPRPDFEYDNPEHRDHLAASDVIQLLKRKEAVSRLMDYLSKMKDRLTADGIEESVEDVTRAVAVQALLSVGSRSFSHFLNVLERYLELLKNLTTSIEARASLLRIVSKFWKRNAQFELIVIDKFLEYRVIDPIDSLRHAFNAYKAGQWGELQFWDGVELTVKKVTRRVHATRAKLEKLKKEEEDERDAARAAGGDILESANGATILGDMNLKDSNEFEETSGTDEAKKESNPTNLELQSGIAEDKKERMAAKQEEIKATQKELDANVAEQGIVLAEAVKSFSIARAEAEAKACEEEEEEGLGSEDEDGRPRRIAAIWKAWWLRGWIREFYRSFAVEISDHLDQIEERLDDLNKEDEKMRLELQQTKDWIESIGFQSI